MIKHLFVWVILSGVVASGAVAQPLGKADSGAPGDAMIQGYLRRETEKIDAKFAEDVKSLQGWEGKRKEYQEEYFYMLGLSPRPEKTALKTVVTRTLDRGEYVVEMVHFQSRPGLYVTGNLYRPAKVTEKLPAILYVCGHSHRGRDGNKVAYQSHGIWFARHGYVCLILDSLELGEIASFHHGRTTCSGGGGSRAGIRRRGWRRGMGFGALIIC